ncbi:MAG: hypothetical protein WEA09_08065 [Gemmatimonadota bacterium]
MSHRRWLSFVLLGHLLLVGISLLPLPYEWIRPARVYTHLLGVEQNWRLFAPAVLRTYGDVEVVAYFRPPGEVSPAEPVPWEVHTYYLQGDSLPLLPHLRNHRGGSLLSRMVSQEGYHPYRIVLARDACEALAGRESQRPWGVTLTGLTGVVSVPWEHSPRSPAYRTDLGGYPC